MLLLFNLVSSFLILKQKTQFLIKTTHKDYYYKLKNIIRLIKHGISWNNNYSINYYHNTLKETSTILSKQNSF